MVPRRTVAAALLMLAATACGGIVVDGPVTEIGDGRICVRPVQDDVPGRGCATYPSEDAVRGITVGDCVRMRLYSESGRFRDVRKRACPG